jgi:hypothetical protein
MHRPVTLLALALAAGILLGQAFLFFPWSTAVLIAVLAAVGIAFVSPGRLDRQRMFLLAAGAAAGMVLQVADTAYVPQRHYRTLPVFDDTARELTGKISSRPGSGSTGDLR